MTPVELVRCVRLDGIAAPAVVLPIEQPEGKFLVLGSGEGATACFIGDKYRFRTMGAHENTGWAGLAIENLSIEIELDSLIPSGWLLPTGALVRKGSVLEMVALADHPVPRPRRLLVQEDLPESPDGLEAAFTRWSLVRREGDRELFRLNIKANSPPTS